MEHAENPRFNMQGYMIEFDKHSLGWTWSKWEYANDWEGKKRVMRRRGSVQFMKMFPGLFPGGGGGVNPGKIGSSEEMEAELQKKGLGFIFLNQGETAEEKAFKTVNEAERFHGLAAYPLWNLTEYWFAFDGGLGSWAMYDAFSGELVFTPASALERLRSIQTAGTPPAAGASRTGRFPNRTSYPLAIPGTSTH